MQMLKKREGVIALPCPYGIGREGFLRFRHLGYNKKVGGKFEERLSDFLSSPSGVKMKERIFLMIRHSGR